MKPHWTEEGYFAFLREIAYSDLEALRGKLENKRMGLSVEYWRWNEAGPYPRVATP